MTQQTNAESARMSAILDEIHRKKCDAVNRISRTNKAIGGFNPRAAILEGKCRLRTETELKYLIGDEDHDPCYITSAWDYSELKAIHDKAKADADKACREKLGQIGELELMAIVRCTYAKSSTEVEMVIKDFQRSLDAIK